tara:strand:+ start:31360 stop:31593 length:234 start_codon:yes stop_codon:yes gene_type:complete
LKKIVTPFASSFLAYQLYQVMLALWMQAGVNFHLGYDFLIAYLISLFGTGIFAFAYPTSHLIDRSYYRLKNKKSKYH